MLAVMKIFISILFLFALFSCSKEAPEGCMVCYDNCISVNDPFYDGLCLSEFRNGGPGSDTFAFFSGLTWTLSAERKLDIEYLDKELPPVCSNSFSDNGAWAEARDDLYHTYYYCKEQ